MRTLSKLFWSKDQNNLLNVLIFCYYMKLFFSIRIDTDIEAIQEVKKPQLDPRTFCLFAMREARSSGIEVGSKLLWRFYRIPTPPCPHTRLKYHAHNMVETTLG